MGCNEHCSLGVINNALDFFSRFMSCNLKHKDNRQAFMFVNVHRFLQDYSKIPIMGNAALFNRQNCYIKLLLIAKMFIRQSLDNDKPFGWNSLQSNWNKFLLTKGQSLEAFSSFVVAASFCIFPHILRKWPVHSPHMGGSFEFVFSAHRGMEHFILVVWLQGMAGVQLDWVISHVAHQRGSCVNH